jgi:hypothetical protein
MEVSMKKLDLKILENADRQTVERLADLCPSAGEKERKKLWCRLESRCKDNSYAYSVEGVDTYKHSIVHHYSMAAMCAAVILMLTGSIFGLKRLKAPDDPPSPSVEMTPSTNVAAETVSDDKANEQTELVLKMLNSIDYYDKVSGRLVEKGNGNTFNDVEFEVDLTTARSYSHIRQCRTDSHESAINGDVSSAELITDENYTCDFIRYSDGNSVYTYDPASKKKEYISPSVKRSDSEKIPDEERREGNSQNLWWKWRTDPLNCEHASHSLFPQLIVSTSLDDQDKWQIDGIQTYIGRECTAISGKDGSFTALIDTQTGVLLKYVETDSNGEICDYICVHSIAFDDEADEVRIIGEPSEADSISTRDSRFYNIGETCESEGFQYCVKNVNVTKSSNGMTFRQNSYYPCDENGRFTCDNSYLTADITVKNLTGKEKQFYINSSWINCFNYDESGNYDEMFPDYGADVYNFNGEKSILSKDFFVVDLQPGETRDFRIGYKIEDSKLDIIYDLIYIELTGQFDTPKRRFCVIGENTCFSQFISSDDEADKSYGSNS